MPITALRLCALTIAMIACAQGSSFGGGKYTGDDITTYVGVPIQQPDSKIELTKVFLLHDHPPVYNTLDDEVEDHDTQACVNFVNDGALTARHVQFTFSYVDATGTTVLRETFDMRGKINPGDHWGKFPGSYSVPNCQSTKGDIYKDGSLILKTLRNMQLTGSVDEVDYADGTSWRAPKP